jgi:PAS domain S-box-containing protein
MPRLTDRRQINLAMLTLVALSTLAWGIAALVLGDPFAWVVLAGSLVFLVLCIAYVAHWEPARYAAVIVSAIMTGLLLPEPFVSAHMPAEVLFPAIFALVVAGPAWMLGATVGAVLLLLIRAGGTGVYAQPPTWISLLMLVGGMALSHVLTRRAREEAETRAAELDAALARADAQAQTLAMQRDELRFQANLLALMGEAVLAIDRAGTVVYWNSAAERIFGFGAAELLGQSITRVATSPQGPELAAEDLQRIARGEPFSGERMLARRSGELFPAAVVETILTDEHGAPTGVLSVISDLSARKLMEQQLVQARRLESIGRLAGGVAHDFNNMLTVINGHAALARESLDPQHPAREDLEAIIGAAARAAALTQQLLAFGRSQALSPQLASLNEVVRAVAPLLKRLINESIAFELQLNADLPLVRIDVNQIEQVLMNLCANARDAMPAGGCLTITTTQVALSATDVQAHPGVAPGAYVLVAISDTGTGMAQDVQQRAFEPFFTTKGEGLGSGLGLAICYGIVRQHEGHIWITSKLGFGTTVRVYLPIADPATERTNADIASVATT